MTPKTARMNRLKWIFIRLFGKRVENWAHDEGIVQVWRTWRGHMMLIHQEKILHGEGRQRQIGWLWWVR